MLGSQNHPLNLSLKRAFVTCHWSFLEKELPYDSGNRGVVISRKFNPLFSQCVLFCCTRGVVTMTSWPRSASSCAKIAHRLPPTSLSGGNQKAKIEIFMPPVFSGLTDQPWEIRLNPSPCSTVAGWCTVMSTSLLSSRPYRLMPSEQ